MLNSPQTAYNGAATQGRIFLIMTDSAKLPKIVILGTGGTIVSSGDDPLMLTGYRIKGLNVETSHASKPIRSPISTPVR